MKYYIDTCILLNLWKKEERNGVKFWRIAQEFLDHTPSEDICISPVVIRELEHVCPKGYRAHEPELLECTIIHPVREDYAFAHSIKEPALSFADRLHIAMARRLRLTIVTRDRMLIDVARQFCAASRPEHLRRPSSSQG